jgi:hypothetical protein
VSACLIVRDEAKQIGRCLESLRPLVDEVIVVDTGSTDETTRIARDLGATVTEEPWRNDFSFHRNQAIDRAGGRWILTIDADEELVETYVAETRQRLSADGLPDILMAAVRLRYPNHRTVSLLEPRLFRRSRGIRYIHPVHEQLDVKDATAVLSNVTLLHHGYIEVEALMAKERRNLALAESMGNASLHGLHCIVRSSFSLGDWPRTLATARHFLGKDATLVLKEEVCALGGAAAFNLRDTSSLSEMITAGLALAPESPDFRFLALLAAASRYLDAIEDEDSTQPKLFLRPPVFHHDHDAIRQVFHKVLEMTGQGPPIAKPHQTSTAGESS